MTTSRIFPNLARSPEKRGDPAVCDGVDRTVSAELAQAGIPPEGLEALRRFNGEVPTKYVGSLYGWGFKRAWYYWVADGPGIPPDVAEYFHQTWGQEVRVAGHCGCPSPIEWFHGFAVGSYHIDTQAGLNAFANLLRSLYRSHHATPSPAPRTGPSSLSPEAAAGPCNGNDGSSASGSPVIPGCTAAALPAAAASSCSTEGPHGAGQEQEGVVS